MKLEDAEKILKNKGIIALPTETVYGLAALASCNKAIEKVFSIKNRPKNNPMIVHVANLNQVKSLITNLPPQAEKLIEAHWPGPLTLILPANLSASSDLVRAGQPTLAIRMPNHPLTRKLIEMTGPIVAPSANISGRPSSTQASHVTLDFGEDFPILDGGACQGGVESTILTFDGEWKIARLGSLSADELAKTLGYKPTLAGKTACPGNLHKHYSPSAKIHLAKCPQNHPAILGFTERKYTCERLLHLGSIKNPNELAFNLYEKLREIDRATIEEIWIDVDFPTHGLYQTIHERLSKAAAKER